MRKHLIIAIAFILLVIVIIFLSNSLKKEKIERIRQEQNVETLNNSVRVYKVRDSINVTNVSALTYTIDELKKYKLEDAKLIKDLGIKNKHLEAIVKVGINTSETITVDKWYPAANNPGCLEYSNKWVKVLACFKDSSVTYSSRDSLDVIVHRVPKRRFLWWSWGTKGYDVEVVNFNPRSTIEYSEFIKIK